MPNIKSAKKRVQVNAVRAARNKAANSELKTILKKANTAIETNSDDKAEAVKVAIKKIDQACAKGLMHKNKAARKKSQIMRKANA
ncbi:30S ribosomal protein S20 [Phocea massiliensis]|uniref:Small ribosomal subunit protein bS20 n=1 Tax=Merdimmobilis hominis TaxID=2897707 RepID=A0A938X902_9FIRM|nr:30S ribosomal protein S20 [Merdimmobilis hominis]MBM6921330.1 30S ribosomal protein S20 [Merdimmobilis hominis]